MLFDNHHRPLQYLRLAVTDRCNLRCHYCMPEHGLSWLSRADLLSFEEMERLCRVFVGLGISKIRITGGEPFVRKNLLLFLENLSKIDGLQDLSITTNGVGTVDFVPKMREIGIKSVNLSLDSLNRTRFFEITRRDELPAVLATLDALLAHDFEVKINAVVMDGQNIDDLIPLAAMTENLPVAVRFIEEMPFNGGSHETAMPVWHHQKILETLQNRWPNLQKMPDLPFSTSKSYQIPGFCGSIGIIAAYSRTFCGSCNRLRVTPQGVLKTCLYDGGVLQIRDLLRKNTSDAELVEHLLFAFRNRKKDGFEAENARENGPILESMAMIGG
jgi:molybdenum cofactor biosynthesis protein A